MSYIIAGLGNPGEEYENTRHNTGRIILETVAKAEGIDSWKNDKVLSSAVAKGKIEGESVVLLAPETYMNKSGSALKTLITSEKKAEKFIVIHDDLDLPLGVIRIVWNRGAGGHRGVESIIRAIKTEKFIRIRVGIAPTTPSGKLRKPEGKKVLDFIIGEFKKPELLEIKKAGKKVHEAIKMIITEDKFRAMTEFN